jgi:nitroreductase
VDIDELLTSTRSARRTLDLTEPVDLVDVAECLRIGLQAPNGTNQQQWRWIVVADADRRAQIAVWYREAYLAMTGGSFVAELLGDDDFGRVMSSTEWLVTHLHEVPVLVIPCYEPYLPRVEGDDQFFAATLYGSIFPAAWNFQLALRSRGYGSCITTLHLLHHAEVAEVLGLPEGVVQGCLLPVGRLTVERTRPAPRRPLDEVVALDTWDGLGRLHA